MMSRTLLVTALAAVLLLPPPQASSAQTAPFCDVGQSPHLAFGFASLKDQIGDAMSDPIECEHANPENGDTLQQTSTGLSFYRKSTNTPTFTDGFLHWGLTADGLVTWTGASVDPPGVVVPTPTATPSPPPATATPTPTASPAATATLASPTSTPTPTFGSRENPIPMGALGRFSDGWNIAVASTTPNANQVVQKANEFNWPPTSGQQFSLREYKPRTRAQAAADSPVRDYRQSVPNRCRTGPHKQLRRNPRRAHGE